MSVLGIDTVSRMMAHYGDPMGTRHVFFDRILDAIEAGDTDEREQLRRIFPEWVAAWDLWQRPHGPDTIRAIFHAELDRAEQGLDFEALV